MYQVKEKKYACIAIIYYILMIAGYMLMGVMYKNGMKYYYLIQWLFCGAAVFLTIWNDKSIRNLGFSKEKLKTNLFIASVIIMGTICFALIYSDVPVIRMFKAVAYYLFYVAFLEEMIFRGFIQNYLFGIHVDRKILFVVGAVFFSLMHLPFQMYVNDMVSVSYIIVAAPQLVFTFLCHLIMCYITYKRKDIIIPTALHFVMDFVQAVI